MEVRKKKIDTNFNQSNKQEKKTEQELTKIYLCSSRNFSINTNQNQHNKSLHTEKKISSRFFFLFLNIKFCFPMAQRGKKKRLYDAVKRCKRCDKNRQNQIQSDLMCAIV